MASLKKKEEIVFMINVNNFAILEDLHIACFLRKKGRCDFFL